MTIAGQIALGRSLHSYALRRLSKEFLAIGCKLHRGEEIIGSIARQRRVDSGDMGACLVEPTGERQRKRGYRQDMRMCVRPGGSFDAPVGGLLARAPSMPKSSGSNGES